MSYQPDDTIAAIGTAAGGAARGMVRVSGPDAATVVGHIFTADDLESLTEVQQPSTVRGRLRIAIDSPAARVMPCDLFLWPTNRSYTREPIAELHTIGSPPLLQAVLATACRAGARLAEPGEFTLRAFLAGRLDLTQAEAVLGVIDAGGSAELDAALAQLAGGLARPLHQLRENLLQLLAELEAGLDFVEEDIRFIPQAEVLARLQAAGRQLDDVGRQMESRHAAIELRQVALVGLPNVGKSSLFNALVAHCGGERTAALVSPHRGTTRDYLTATISLGGVPCELVDTAGVDNSDEYCHSTTIDAAAQSLATERRQRAAVRACCIPAPEYVSDGGAADRSFARHTDCELIVLTKSDLAPPRSWPLDPRIDKPVVVTSSQTGAGLDELCATLRNLLAQEAAPRRGAVIAATAERCGESIRLAAQAIEAAVSIARAEAGDELVAAELRIALAELGSVVGAVYTDDLLDRIFRTFCIGK